MRGRTMFSLRTLFVAMAIAAICIAGLVQRTPLWANIVVGSSTLCLLGYSLIAIYLSPSNRPFFVPAVIAGCLYGAAAYWQPPSLVTDGLLFSWWYSDNSVSVDKLFRKVSEMPWNMAVMSAVLSDKPERIAPYLNSFGVLVFIAYSSVTSVTSSNRPLDYRHRVGSVCGVSRELRRTATRCECEGEPCSVLGRCCWPLPSRRFASRVLFIVPRFGHRSLSLWLLCFWSVGYRQSIYSRIGAVLYPGRCRWMCLRGDRILAANVIGY